MSWAEDLFQKAEDWLNRIDRKRKGVLPGDQAVSLVELSSLLHWWVLLLAGRSWTIQASESWPALDHERLFFPPVLEIFDDKHLNTRAYLYIACFLLGFNEENMPSIKKWRLQFQSSSTIMAEGEFPEALLTLNQVEDVKAIREGFNWTPCCFRSLMNLWMVRTIMTPAHSRQGHEEQLSSSGANIHKKKKPREKIEVIEQLGDKKNENPLIHSFEKLHTTDDYKGGQKKQDGEDELSEHGDSIEDLDLRQVVRTSQETKATLKGDYVMDLEVAESLTVDVKPDQKVFQYDEWNESRSEYHLKWCTLYEKIPVGKGGPKDNFDLEKIKKENRAEIKQLTRCFYDLFQSPKWKTRQPDGTELDLDALVSYLGIPLEKRPEKMNVYMSRKKNPNELGVVLLFDRSLSSDSWVNNRRVLDIIRGSLVIMGEALKKFPFPVKLAAFSSQTRNKIHYDVLKDFDEEWSHGLTRLGSIDPFGYTRIGPAIRHAAADLKGKKTKYKWIILLSDSKPTDFDKYEGWYGTRDVRKAVQEARLQNIGVRCLSIEKENRMELTEMFGPRGFEMLSNADQLPERLGNLLRNLVQMAR